MMSLPITLTRKSLLTITFSARGEISGAPNVFVVRCFVDKTPCEPTVNAVQFLYPIFCCDTRSFTWVAVGGPGGHGVTIIGGTTVPGRSLVYDRTLHVEAAAM